jgi:hypothetical protein
MNAPGLVPTLLLLMLAAVQLFSFPIVCTGWPTTPAAAAAALRSSASPQLHLTIFGDSNSDAGNAPFAIRSFHKLTNNTLPDPRYYHGGRFSDGLVWADSLAASGVNVSDYAVGFGTACTSNSFRNIEPHFPPIPASAQQQVAAHIQGLQVIRCCSKYGYSL